jgi:hypothetical protein
MIRPHSKMKRLAIPTMLVALHPCIALAHGEEVVFLPVGQLVALVVVGILLWRLPFRGVAVRVFSVMCVAGVTLPLWFATVSWFPAFLRGAAGFFLVGLVPAVVVVLAIFLLQRRLVRERNDT